MIFTSWTMNLPRKGRLRAVETILRYDTMLEVEGIYRSPDVRVNLHREVEPGETINVRGRDWLVTEVSVAKSGHGIDRRLVAREVVKEAA